MIHGPSMETEDGEFFIKNLAYYIRTHEKALANSLLLQRRPPSHPSTSASSSTNTTAASNAPLSSTTADAASARSSISTLSESLYNRLPVNLKPARLFLSPNQLYYLLSRFEELAVDAGPMNIRLENIHAQSSSANYVSFLHQTETPKVRSIDQDSIHSVSSVRSVVSSMSSLWSNLRLSSYSAAKTEKQKAIAREDLKYLYSAFTKIPCVKLSVDHRIRRIAGYEEFPFDAAVPVHVFKNLTALEIADLDFRSFFGWDRLADSLQSLTLKRASLEEVADLLTNVVLDDMDQRRRRSVRTPDLPLSTNAAYSPNTRSLDILRSPSPPKSSHGWQQSASSDGSAGPAAAADGERNKSVDQIRVRTPSPRSSHGTKESIYSSKRPSNKDRRYSGGSSTSWAPNTPRQSTSNLLLTQIVLPSTKWRFLRHLSLTDNALTSIDVASLSPIASTLQSLDLSSNLFSELPDSLASLTALRALNLSNCLIDSLRSLSRTPLPAITVLNLRSNRIGSLAGIEKLLSLQRLDIRDNKLRDPTELARLTCMPDFSEVYVKHNHFVKSHSMHRVTIFNLFRSTPGYRDDIRVDGSGPKYSERRHLVDRAPEVTPGLATKELLKQEPGQGTEAAATASGSERPPEDADTTSKDTTAAERSTSLRRKGPRRRVVDMTETATPHTASSGASHQSSANARYLTARENPSSADRDQAQDTPVRHNADGSKRPSVKSIGDLANPEPRQLTDTDISITSFRQSSDLYKQRIEALRNERGNTWLGALGNESSQGGTGPFIAHEQAQKPQLHT